MCASRGFRREILGSKAGPTGDNIASLYVREANDAEIENEHRHELPSPRPIPYPAKSQSRLSSFPTSETIPNHHPTQNLGPRGRALDCGNPLLAQKQNQTDTGSRRTVSTLLPPHNLPLT